MMLSAGVDVSDMDTTGTPYSMMNEEQLQAVQNNAMEPELKQIGGNALKFGNALDANNEQHVQVAKEFGMTIPEFNKHVKVSYETQMMSRIKNAGSNYNQLINIKKEVQEKGVDFLKGTSLSVDTLDRQIADSKGLHQRDMYTALNRVLNMKDPNTMTSFLGNNKDRIEKYQQDGVLPKNFSADAQKLIQKTYDADVDALNNKQRSVQLTELQKIIKLGEQTNFTDAGVNKQITNLATSIGVEDPNALITNEKARLALDDELRDLNRLNSQYSLADKIEKDEYDRVYGTGFHTVPRFNPDGTVSYTTGKPLGKIDVQKVVRKFETEYEMKHGFAPTREQMNKLKERLESYNLLLNAERDLQRAVSQ